ncbi:hypothetical protein CUR178_08155 [Leishmania enriettii]|uniref:non-specific serine/threonine protein kinase n=1 Tax=Leishmania enriettii TaxID=5663 RepID=A0A836HT70_LEIEN|nr:hypothetical protein CUR178_08155 [Leishmania enriettii]
MESFIAGVEEARLKLQLNKIMADVSAATSDSAAAVSARGTENVRQCVLEFAHFFLSVAEQHGTTPHAVLGQHVVSNVLIFVLERIVKPNLMAYCRVAEKHAASAVAASADTVKTTCFRAGPVRSGADVVATGRRDALEARRRRLRGDIIRPFTQLFQSLHTSLVEESEPLMSWSAEGRGSALSGTRRSAAVHDGGTHNELLASASAGGAPPSFCSVPGESSRGGPRSGECGGLDDPCSTASDAHDDGLLINGASEAVSQAPLLWKNASPLNILCNHILEVLESQWLVAVVGSDYAALLIEVLQWSGYARLITPTYLVRLSQCLISLIQRVSIVEEANTGMFTVAPNLVTQEVVDGRLWIAAPCADDACLYAQVLMRVCALPQITTAYPPASSTATDAGRHGGGGISPALALVQRVMEVVRERHRAPTPDLRLEAYCIAALRQLCHRFRYDHPIAARAPVEVVRLLCDFFFLPHHTPRHDVWRLETMRFVAVVLSVAFADVVGEELWRDIHAHSRHAATAADTKAAAMQLGARDVLDEGKGSEQVDSGDRRGTQAVGAVLGLPMQRPSKRLVALLHQSVFPMMLRIFTQHRHAYSFTSRRELFSFPCAPLQEVFDFGAVVLYVSSVTHGAYSRWRAAQENCCSGGVTARCARRVDGEEAELEEDTDEEQMPANGTKMEERRARKRRRGIEPGHGGAGERVVEDRSADAPDAAPTQPPGTLHPTQILSNALQEEFFMPAGPAESGAAAASATAPAAGPGGRPRPPLPGAMVTRRRAGAAPLVLRIGTSNVRTSSAAVQDVVSDTALFILHLFAQPCAMLRVPECVADCLVEDVLLPLCGHFGLRLGQLLLAAMKAVLPRCSLVTQRAVFAVVAQHCLPTVTPVAGQWPSRLGGVGGSAAFCDSREENALAPSESVYHVLVASLEQHLHRRHELKVSTVEIGGALRSSGSAGASGRAQPVASSTGMPSGLLVFWDGHHRTLIERVVARLHAWEQDMRRICEGKGATASPAGATSEAARLQIAFGAEKRSHEIGGDHHPHLLLLPPSLVLLLTRFATLVQYTRLQQMASSPSISVPGSPGTMEAVPQQRHLSGHIHPWTLIDGPSGDIALRFVCHVAANATLFFASVPVIACASDGVSTSSGVVGDGARAVRQASGAGADAVGLFSAPQFATWLGLADSFGCAALRMCLARQQVEQQAEMVAWMRRDRCAALDGVSSLSTSSATNTPRLRGPLRQEVSGYVERMCALLDAVVTSPPSQVPAVLRDAADAHWILRQPLRMENSPVDAQSRSFSAGQMGEEVRADKSAGGFGTGVSPLRMAATRRAVPRAFQVMLASSVQESVAWLMRRAQLRYRLAESASAEVARHEGSSRGGRGSAGESAAARLGVDTPAVALQLSVQCVQLLHLLLRWRRAALWSPPEESVCVRGHSDADSEGCVAARAAAKGTPLAGPAVDDAWAAVASDCSTRAAVAGSDVAADLDVDEKTSASRADLCLLRSSPDLFAVPLSLLERFTAAGGGRLYYAVLWLCHHVSAELDRRHAVGAFFPLWAALHFLFRDVGTVLLDPDFACLDPRQTIVRFTAAVSARIFEDGVRGLSRWRPSNPTSRELTHIVAGALHMSLDTLRAVLWASSRTGVGACAVEPLADTSAIRRTVMTMLHEQALLDGGSAGVGATSDVVQGGDEDDIRAQEDVLLPSSHRLLDKVPFLPTILLSLPALLRLLALIGCLSPQCVDACTVATVDWRCCRAVVQVLQVLFARYRYHLGPGLCSGLVCGTVTDIRQLLLRRGATTVQGEVQRVSQGCRSAAAFLYTHAGRLLEMWAGQLMDPARADMPVCTPAWQCALLQAAFTVLPCCEPVVAEALGRISFRHLAEKTPYEVRHYAALQVGGLFRTFSTRRSRVFRALLSKAREGVLSATKTLCSTSLLALLEAVRAAPELLVDALFTLLECWATGGFTHHRLVAECLEQMSAWVLEDAALAVSTVRGSFSPRTLPYAHLCRMHVRPLLFMWLCEYRHPPAALPVECFGYPTQAAFIEHHLSVLSPLALLLMTESTDARWSLSATSSHGDRSVGTTAEGSLYEQLVSAYADVLGRMCTEESKGALEGLKAARRRRRVEVGDNDGVTEQGEAAEVEAQTDAAMVPDASALHRLAPLCLLLAYFPEVVAQLLVITSHAPVSPLPGAAAGLVHLEEAGSSLEHVDWTRRMGHADAEVEHRGSGAGQSHHASAFDSTPAWALVGERCLYWIEAQFNTAEATLWAQSVGLVLTGRGHMASESVQTAFSADAARAALSDPTKASSAAEVLFHYLQHRSVSQHCRPLFNVVLAAQADMVIQALVALHRPTTESGAPVYGAPEQLQRATSWVAEKIASVPLPLPDRQEAAARRMRANRAHDTAGSEEGTTQGLTADRTSSSPADWEAFFLALLVPSAVEPEGEFHSPTTDEPSTGRLATTSSLTEDAMSQFLLRGSCTYLYALLHAAYRSSVAPSSLELQLRAPQQLSLLVHISTHWCSARVLAEPRALRLVLTHLLHWLHRSPSAAVRRLVCDALLHVWQVGRAGTGSIQRRELKRAAPAAERRQCQLILARALAPLTAVSPLVASTYAALIRSDPDLKRLDWPQQALAYLVDAEGGRPAERAGGRAAGGTGRVWARGVVDVDEPMSDEVEKNGQDTARGGALEASVRDGAPEAGAYPDDCALRLDGEQWTPTMYEAHRPACLAPLSSKSARERLSGLRRLLRYILGHGDEDSEGEYEGALDAVEGLGDSLDVDKLVLPESCAVSVQAIVEGVSTTALPPAPLLRDVTMAVDSAQTLLVRCLQVAAVCREPSGAAQYPSRSRMADLLDPAELSALSMRAVMLDTIQLLYRVCHVGMTSVLNEDASAPDGLSALSAVRLAGVDADAADPADLLMLTADTADEQLLAAFRLLRALSLCVVLSGGAATLPHCAAAVSRPLSAGGSTAGWRWHEEQLSGVSAAAHLTANETALADVDSSSGNTAEDILSGVLAQAYAHLLGTLEQLVWCADADASELGMCALRIWVLCIASSLRKANGLEQAGPGEVLSSFDEAVAQLMVSAWLRRLAAPSVAAGEAVGTGLGDKTKSAKARLYRLFQRRLAWVTRSGSCGSPARRRHGGCDTLGDAADAHLRSSSVWAPLRQCPPNQRAFLCRFVLAAANTYGILKRSVLWAALVPLLMAELRTVEGTAAALKPTAGSPAWVIGGTRVACNVDVRVAEQLLPPLLLHALCSRESEGQRAMRQEWSELLDRYVFQQAGRCAQTARVFLHLLGQCYVVLLRATRQRGLKGATAASSARAKAPLSSSAAAASGDGERAGAVPWPSILGSVPSLQDMKECYWLSDIPAKHLARAAVQVGEPHFALLFSQLSGESLYGPRTGAAALCAEAETTRSAVLLRESASAGEAVLAVSSAPFSVLFPATKPGDYPSVTSMAHAASSGAARSSARARERHDAVRQQTRSFAEDIFDLYVQVQEQLELDDIVGVSLMTRLHSFTHLRQHGNAVNWGSLAGSNGAPCTSLRGATHGRSNGNVIRRAARYRESGMTAVTPTATEADSGLAAEPTAAAAWLERLRFLEERETHRASDEPSVRDVLLSDAGAGSEPSGANGGAGEHSVAMTGEAQGRRPDPWAAHLQRAALLLQHGFPSTALDVLLSLDLVDRRQEAAVRRRIGSSVGERGVSGDSVQNFSDWERAAGSGGAMLEDGATLAGTACGAVDDADPETVALPSWTLAHEASLRALLAEAAWKCGRWSCGGRVAVDRPSECVPRAVLHRLSLQGSRMEPQAWVRPLTQASAGSFYEHLLYAFIALTSGQPLLSMQHVRRAESILCRQLSSINFVANVMAAEALNEVRDCAARFFAAELTSRKGSAGMPLPGLDAAPQRKQVGRLVELPVWIRSMCNDSTAQGSSVDAAVLPTTRMPPTVDYTSRKLLDSVRHALCQVYGDDEGWYRFVLGATEQALLNQDAAAAHRWLSDWEEQHTKDRGGEAEQASPASAIRDTAAADSQARQRHMDLVLRAAQVAYGLGRWQEAIAILQPAAAVPRGNAALSRIAQWHAPEDPRVVQQLMVWHGELRLLPPSQLVRDPFLSRAAASDSSGACSFLLARLCHTLADDIAARLTSHEHQQLRESVEESKRLRADLEAQLEAAAQPSAGRAAPRFHRPSAVTELAAPTGATTTAVLPAPANTSRVAPLGATRGRSAIGDAAAEMAAGTVPPVIFSEDQLRVIRRRIRELTGDIRRLEDEWHSEESNFGLYRRSALNAYSRFLQFNQAAQHCPARGVAGRTHRGAPALSEVKCLPVDHEEDVVHAVFGFVELWLNVADRDQCGSDVLCKVLDKAVERIPTAVFVPLAGQLTAQLGCRREGKRLAFLVARLARDYPMHVVWPLLALCHGHTFAKSPDVNTLHSVDEAKITAARQLLGALTSAKSPDNAAGRAGHSASGAALLSTHIQQAQLLSSAYLELAFDRSAATAQTGRRHTISSDFMLIKEVQNLSIPPPSSVDPSITHAGASGVALAVPCVTRYRNYFTTPGGVNVPKVLHCELSDGTVVRQLLKAGDDLRQDALIEQVFATANRLFRRRPATRPLQIRTFTIAPLAPTAGILQWVEHTTPLGEYLTGRYAGREELPGAHERYFPGEPTTRECRIQLQNAPQSSKCQVLLSLYENFTPALHYFFLEQYPSVSVWVDRQQAFTRSVATSSIVGYVVGLGDRHINNILLHTKTAEVVHIDLGIAFDQSRLLPVPELVPFRLTRNIIDGLGVRGTEGALCPCAEAAMHLLRGKRELVRTILSSIMHDPLARWAIGSPTHTHHMMGDGSGGAGNGLYHNSTRQPAPERMHGSSADAARTLARIDAKLRGYDGGDVLSVPTHVRKLVEEAQRVERLAVMFAGWSQWV